MRDVKEDIRRHIREDSDGIIIIKSWQDKITVNYAYIEIKDDKYGEPKYVRRVY